MKYDKHPIKNNCIHQLTVFCLLISLWVSVYSTFQNYNVNLWYAHIYFFYKYVKNLKWILYVNWFKHLMFIVYRLYLPLLHHSDLTVLWMWIWRNFKPISCLILAFTSPWFHMLRSFQVSLQSNKVCIDSLFKFCL